MNSYHQLHLKNITSIICSHANISKYVILREDMFESIIFLLKSVLHI